VPGLREAIGLVSVLAAVTACAAPSPTPTPGPTFSSGGTLRIAFPDDPGFVRDFVYADPGRINPGFFMRCCLGRTLLTYPGEATIDGGTTLIPDLAEGLPQVSRDGLSLTFTLKPGIKYAPPNDGIEVTSADFVTAVERSLRINGGDVFPPLQLVEGALEYAEGSAASVSGLQTPDPLTLVIRLVRPYGALDFLADPVWAPIPASVAAGHDENLGLYWPSTGPYMYETYPGGAADTEFALIRNPSWSAATDPRRLAFVDRIEIFAPAISVQEAWDSVNASEYDFVGVRLDDGTAQRFKADSGVAPRLRSTADTYLFQLPMNLAVPPFDDVAVRRAVALALNRVALRDAVIERLVADGRVPPPMILSEHMFGDAVSDGLLVGYDPFELGDGMGDLARARASMADSTYDTDGDGVCDAAACSGIRLATFDEPAGQIVAESLAPLGLGIVVELETDDGGMFIPANHVPIAVNGFGWGFDLSGTEMAQLAQGPAPGLDGSEFVVNGSLMGAQSEDLATWGYSVTSVPSVDDLIVRCDLESGSRRAQCYADLDQVLSEAVVPWVPLFGRESVWLASPRVEHFTLDQSVTYAFPALDKVSLVPGSD
jgi:ABC-type transport system substrate-binding protein